jgi:dihydrofolate synthase/folylpolyglutamate synthase
MTYEAMLQKLYNLKGTGLDLISVLGLLGSPEKKLRCIRVGGTNGKGSTCAFLAQLLQEAGYTVGLFTSPHLIDPEERIQINGQLISREDFLRFFEKIWASVLELHGSHAANIARFFEILVAIALLYFHERDVDIAIIEAGVGGRRDDTNVVYPLFGILTNVDLDHQEVLGETIEAIATEKVGIAPPGVALLCAERRLEALAVIERECRCQSSSLLSVPAPKVIQKISDWENQRFDWQAFTNLEIQMRGAYQIENAATALAALELLKDYGFNISERATRQGLKKATWPGRMELLQKNPYLLLDGAKNPAGLRALRESLRELEYSQLILILGISTRKDISEMMAEILPIADKVIITQAAFRGNEPMMIASTVQKYTHNYEIIPEPALALEQALKSAQPDDLLCVTGSLFLVGEIRKIWQHRQFAKAGEIG